MKKTLQRAFERRKSISSGTTSHGTEIIPWIFDRRKPPCSDYASEDSDDGDSHPKRSGTTFRRASINGSYFSRRQDDLAPSNARSRLATSGYASEEYDDYGSHIRRSGARTRGTTSMNGTFNFSSRRQEDGPVNTGTKPMTSGYTSEDSEDCCESHVRRSRATRRRASLSSGYFSRRQDDSTNEAPTPIAACMEKVAPSNRISKRRRSITSWSYASEQETPAETDHSRKSAVTGRRRASMSAISSSARQDLDDFSSNNNSNKALPHHIRVGKIPSKSPDFNRHRQRPNVALREQAEEAETATPTPTTISTSVTTQGAGATDGTTSTAAAVKPTASIASSAASSTPILISPLPKNLNVLLVESDPILRKMIKKTLKSVEPTWKIKEASDGETALAMVADALPLVFPHNDEGHTQKKPFDLIFIDQYLSSSADRKLLGTETVPKLRDMGATCCICGLSAHMLKEEFQMVGANSFLLKPLPSNKYILIDALAGIIKKKRRRASA
ncbi:hypothetical protein ACA910_006739 [Epithemia clementina (nom. ined.)]